jgi:hypothetical protein
MRSVCVLTTRLYSGVVSPCSTTGPDSPYREDAAESDDDTSFERRGASSPIQEHDVDLGEPHNDWSLSSSSSGSGMPTTSPAWVANTNVSTAAQGDLFAPPSGLLPDSLAFPNLGFNTDLFTLPPLLDTQDYLGNSSSFTPHSANELQSLPGALSTQQLTYDLGYSYAGRFCPYPRPGILC